MFWGGRRKVARTTARELVSRMEVSLARIETELRRIHPEIIGPHDATELRRQFIEVTHLTGGIARSVLQLMDE